MSYFRLHRRFKLLPGVRVNVAKTGPSISLGTNGAMVNVGRLGVRTTVGLPGSGMSVINRTSWQSMTGNKPQAQPDTDTAASVDAALDGMSHRKQREFFIKMVAASSLADVKAQRQAFEAQLTERAAEIDEIDRIDAHDIRQIYADAIAAKENATSRAITIPLVLVVFGGLGMWAGIANGNGWVIAASVCLLLWALGTKAGQLFTISVAMLALCAVGLITAAAFVGFVTLVIMGASGKL